MKQSEVKRLAVRFPKYVEWSEEDQCFVGRCPLLFAGGVHGDSEAEVYRELCQVAEEWVMILSKKGEALPEVKPTSAYSGKFMVRVDPALHQRLAMKAVVTGESLNQFVSRTLAES